MVDNFRSVLEIHHLTQRFDGQVVVSLDHWSVPKGRHRLILGASGSGKSTLLHLIAGLLPPSEGQITIDNQVVTGLSAKNRDTFRGRHLGIVLQNLHLLSALSIRDNLRLAQSLGKVTPEPERIDDLLRNLGLLHLAQQKPDQLSQGERQRVAIARALVNRPILLLADEPTSALDDRSALNVLSLLKEQASQSGATLIVATHDARITSHFDDSLVLEGRA